MEAIKDNIVNVKENIEAKIPYSSNKYISGSKEFLSSNSLIAKATFIIFMLIIFVLLFLLGIKIIKIFIEPTDTPYLINGMISNQSKTISQSLSDPGSKFIKRSTNEYNGIEFTYSVWINIDEISTLQTYTHVFSKGTNNYVEDGILQPSNSPGLYIFKGQHEPTDTDIFDISNDVNIYSGLIIVNIYNQKSGNVKKGNYPHEERIYITGIPIKKWVNIIIRTDSQNLLDIYINGVLHKRHKLENVIRQNYDSVHVNYGNRLDGKISDLKYYNYAIGTFEIDKIMKKGPNLKPESKNIFDHYDTSDYISRDWFYPDNRDYNAFIE